MTFEEEFPGLKIVYLPLVIPEAPMNKKVVPYVQANKVQKHCFSKERVRKYFHLDKCECFEGLECKYCRIKRELVL